MPTHVVLDTNALMMPVECDVRVFEELDRLLDDYEPVVPRAVVAELEKLARGNGAEATAASVGRDLADRCTVVDHDADYADDAVVEVATGGGRSVGGGDSAPAATDAPLPVVTNDRPLARRLRELDVPVISLRGRNKLALTR